jgi:hypothetical protein
MPRVAQPLEELARFLELLGPRALGEIAADHDEVGLFLMNALLDRLDQPRIVRTEMQIRQMDEASHDARTRLGSPGSPFSWSENLAA